MPTQQYHLSNNYFQQPLEFGDLMLLQLGRCYCNADFRILLGDPSHISVYTLAELLPFSFSLEKDQGGTSL